MSLHRVSSMSSYEHVRGSSPARSEHRKMSFNPAGSWGPPAKEEPIGAFEVSKSKRILQVAVAVVYCLFSAGVVFGYAALKPVLVEEGVYRQYCMREEVSISETTCYEQEIRLNIMFTTAAVATNICALPVGTILDKYGPRISGFVGCFFLIIGSLFMAFAAQLPFDAYIPGYLFLALGGPFVFISSFQLSNTFPQHSGLILALLTGAFDSSSAIFLFYRLIYTATNGVFSPQRFFLIYLVVPLFITAVQIFLMPANSYKTVGELVKQVEEPLGSAEPPNYGTDNSSPGLGDHEQRRKRQDNIDSEITSLLGKDGNKQQKEEDKKRNISGVWGVLHGRSALGQIKTPWFWLIALFTVVQMLRINYFVATVTTQYDYILNSDELAEHVNHVFDVALPVGGVLSVPFIGLILDNTSTTFTLGLLVTVSALIGIFGCLPYLWAAYANIALFVLYRPFYYTAVSDYSGKVFGYHTFGKVYGLIICMAGLLNFSQAGLDALTHKIFSRDPLPVNLILLFVALIIGLALVGFVYWKSRSMKRNQLEDEAEETPDTLMPGAVNGTT
ncbi:hypothetical protein ACLMJK_008411 [Lecanora helva]